MMTSKTKRNTQSIPDRFFSLLAVIARRPGCESIDQILPSHNPVYLAHAKQREFSLQESTQYLELLSLLNHPSLRLSKRIKTELAHLKGDLASCHRSTGIKPHQSPF